jgi:hypothetical protein
LGRGDTSSTALERGVHLLALRFRGGILEPGGATSLRCAVSLEAIENSFAEVLGDWRSWWYNLRSLKILATRVHDRDSSLRVCPPIHPRWRNVDIVPL